MSHTVISPAVKTRRTANRHEMLSTLTLPKITALIGGSLTDRQNPTQRSRPAQRQALWFCLYSSVACCRWDRQLLLQLRPLTYMMQG